MDDINIVYDKPFRTYKEQIEILRSRNIVICDENEAEAVLSTLSYYSLINGYKESFLAITGTDMFIMGTTIETIYSLHL